MVEQDTIDRIDTVALPVDSGHPVAIQLSGCVRAGRPEWGIFRLGSCIDIAVQLAGRGLIEPDPGVRIPDRIEDSGNAQTVNITGGGRLLEGGPHEALGRQVVDFMGFGDLDCLGNRGRIDQVGRE